jgi:hypothetical protein
MKLLTPLSTVSLLLTLASSGLHAGQDGRRQGDAMKENTEALYQIEVASKSAENVSNDLEGDPFSQFDHNTLVQLLNHLAISPDQQKETSQRWQERYFSMGDVHHLQRLTNLIREPVIYIGAELRDLQVECERVQPTVRGSQMQTLLQDLSAASSKALERSGEIIIYKYPPAPLNHKPPRNPYTIEVVPLGKELMNGETVAQFDDAAFADLWDDLGVSQEDWDRWKRGPHAGSSIPLIEALPLLSRLASVDEGAIHYKDAALRILRAEAEIALSSVKESSARNIVQKLLNACDLAIQNGGQVIVHPFGSI